MKPLPCRLMGLFVLALGAAPVAAWAEELAPSAKAPSAAPAPPPPSPPPSSWLDKVDLTGFVDTYFSFNYFLPRPGGGVNLYHPYDQNTGFGLAWFGLDAFVEPDPVGGQVSVRLGPAVPNLALGDFNLPGGIGYLQDAFLTFRPGGKSGRVTLFAGKFDTIYGAEVAQSQLNINYTRGALYNLAQPFFHTGLRADWQATDKLLLKLLLVNGWNDTLDDNLGKSFGAQLSYAFTDRLGVSIGYLGGPEQADTRRITCDAGFAVDRAAGGCTASAGSPGGSATLDVHGANLRLRHLGDLVVDYHATERLRLLANADIVTDQVITDPARGTYRTVLWYGASLMGRWAATDVFAVGLRGEIVGDPDAQITAPNTEPLTLVTGTVTLEAAATRYLLVRLDTRVDAANKPVFPRGLEDTGPLQLTSTLGLVAKTK